jgi:type IV pilus assembly protein PilW
MISSRKLRQSGFSLIEILVSITIGLIIMVAIGAVYQTSSSIQRQKEDYDEVNDPIKMVSSLLRANVAQAGYVDFFDATAATSYGSSIFRTDDLQYQNTFVRNSTVSVPVTPLQRIFGGLFPVFGCDGVMNSTPNALATTAPPLALGCSATISTTQHTLQLAYQAVPSSTNASASNSLTASSSVTGEGRDCVQQTIAGTSGIVINRFFVRTNAGDNTNELYCSGSGNATAQPVARGVEEFVVRYQIAQAGTAAITSAGGAKSQYLTATQVSADTIGWPGVSGVELCMVVATPQIKGAAATGTAALQPTLPTCTRTAAGAFNANINRTAGDTRLWKRFTYTIAVKNAVYAFPS